MYLCTYYKMVKKSIVHVFIKCPEASSPGKPRWKHVDFWLFRLVKTILKSDKIFGQNIEDNIIDRVILATKQVISKKQATN